MDRRDRALPYLVAVLVFIAAVTTELLTGGRVATFSARWWVLALYWLAVPFIVSLYTIARAVPPEKVDRRLPATRAYVALVVAPALLFLAGTFVLLASLNPWLALVLLVGMAFAGMLQSGAAPRMNDELQSEIEATRKR